MKTLCRFTRLFRVPAIPMVAALAFALTSPTPVQSAGVLTPNGSPNEPLRLVDHHVQVTLNNGFARTEVTQSFYNPNPQDLEAVYRFPLPKSSSLSEVSLTLGEREIHGEVVEKSRARTIYEEEKKSGNDAGMAKKETFRAYEFRVTPVRAQQQTRLRLVYYQPLEIDTGVCRYLYPLEEGGTDDTAAASFWGTANSKLDGTFSADVEVKSAWPITSVRLPGFDSDAKTNKIADGHYKVQVERKNHPLTKDLVVYYRLEDNLPGRVEVIPFRASESGPGTFMMVVTPGLDLQPLSHGADYVFVLDTSGSMTAKLHTLAKGVSQVIGKMSSQDRFRVISFADRATDVTGWQEATPTNVERALQQIQNLRSAGSTNLYEGLSMAMQKLDADRATSVVLVTDGVTNTGILDPASFHQLVKSHDIRIFGFLMGNSANWPLMRTVCETSGGFYAGVSNDDDLLGQILQAKGKVLHECLHDAEFTINGVKTLNTTGNIPGKIYRGQQLVMFGQYEKGGDAELVLKARLTGEDKVYRTTFKFPETDLDNPEIERLWALDQIEQYELRANTGNLPQHEADNAILSLGLQYQLVTDQTSMVVLNDDAFARHGIDRQNQARTGAERAAHNVRQAAPAATNYRVDAAQPMTPHSAPSVAPPQRSYSDNSTNSTNSSGGSWFPKIGGGGGAISPQALLALALFSGLALLSLRRVSGVARQE